MTAPKPTTYTIVLDYPTGGAGLVPRKLLPDGQHWPSIRRQIWHKQDYRVGERISISGNVWPA